MGSGAGPPPEPPGRPTQTCGLLGPAIGVTWVLVLRLLLRRRVCVVRLECVLHGVDRMALSVDDAHVDDCCAGWAPLPCGSGEGYRAYRAIRTG